MQNLSRRFRHQTKDEVEAPRLANCLPHDFHLKKCEYNEGSFTLLRVAYFSVAPPGVGKTLPAKAVVGANFFSIFASQFVEIYVGVGDSRVRSLYQEAEDNVNAISCFFSIEMVL
ncbi:hypothetical protein WN944_005935 [Citrus x changshan-huyou]|uniref:ATPase AAA-type core domain-containing protein n=1 Tax=Citrus x changshan-huyou TaxID=2935761 RepID=A0AAP0MIA9_9ROSI